MGWDWASRTLRECSAQVLRLLDRAVPPNPFFSQLFPTSCPQQDGFKGIYPKLIPARSRKEALEGFQSPEFQPRKFQVGISASNSHSSQSSQELLGLFPEIPVPVVPRAGKDRDEIPSHPNNPWEVQPGFSPSQPRQGCPIPTKIWIMNPKFL